MNTRNALSLSTVSKYRIRFRRYGIANFTLLELLIIVGLIAILAGNLLPALGSDLAKAQRIWCSDNLKQQAACHAQYQDDFDGYICRVDNEPKAGSRSPFWLLLEGYITPKEELYDHASKYRSRYFHCPSNLRNDRALVEASLQSTVNNYGGNAYLGAKITLDTDYFVKISTIKNAADLVVSMDGIPDPKDETKITHYIAVAPFWGGYKQAEQSRAHEGTFNNLMLDGHTEANPPDQLTNQKNFFVKAPAK